MRTPELADEETDSPESALAEQDKRIVSRFMGGLRATWRVPLLVTFALLILAIAVLAILRVMLPTTTTFISQFHFTFPGAETGRYPNAMVFSINEIVDPEILNTVYDELDLGKYGIERKNFYGAFSIRPFLLTETEIADRYRQELTDRRLSFTERERIERQLKDQLEQASRGAAELSFTVQSLLGIPTQIGRAIVAKVPFVWSKLAIERKGVLRIPGFSADQYLIPQSSLDRQPLPLQLVSLTVAGHRLQDRLVELLDTPGTLTVRDPVSGESMRDIGRHIRDFQLFYVNPLRNALVTYHFKDGSEELQQIVERRIADIEIEVADLTKQAQAISENISEFVQTTVGLKGRAVEIKGADNAAAGSGTTIPQVGESFIDRVIQLTQNEQEAEQLRRFVSARTAAQYELNRRAVALLGEERGWKELRADLRANNATQKDLDPTVDADLVQRLHNAVEQANLKWESLSRIEKEFAANRTNRTGEIYTLYATSHDVISSNPILNWTVMTAVILATMAIFLGVWIIRAMIVLTRYHSLAATQKDVVGMHVRHQEEREREGVR